MEIITDALLKLCLLKPEFFICAFPGKIIIGQPRKLLLHENKCFTIFRFEYPHFFQSLYEICVLLSTDTTTKANNEKNKKLQIKEKGLLVKKSDTCFYFWLYQNELIKFGIEEQGNTIFTTVFSEVEFFNLLQCFKDSLLPTLILNHIETELFVKLSKLSLKELCEYQKHPQNIEETLKCLKCDGTVLVNTSIIIRVNLDILIIYHKLESLGCDDFIIDSIKMITGASQKNA